MPFHVSRQEKKECQICIQYTGPNYKMEKKVIRSALKVVCATYRFVKIWYYDTTLFYIIYK